MCASLLLLTATNSQAQECYGCESSGFSYPSGGYVGGNAGHPRPRKEKWDAWKAESAKIQARNDAWPKPFACQDRMAYYSVWDVMINQGYAQNCVLGSQHFKPESNELNQAGLLKIANLMQNMPSDRRNLLVARDGNDMLAQSRIDHVNQVVRTYHGHAAENMMIGITDMQPAMMSGVQADAIAKGHLEGLPSPIIPVTSIGAGVSGSSGQ